VLNFSPNSKKHVSFPHFVCRHTYEIAPVLTLIEMEVIEHMAKLVGYANAEGTFNPGRKVFTQNDCGCPTVR